MYMKDGPSDFVKYCEKWAELAEVEGKTIVNEDLYRLVNQYNQLYALENPRIEDIDNLITLVEAGKIGSIKTDLKASILRWKKTLMEKD